MLSSSCCDARCRQREIAGRRGVKGDEGTGGDLQASRRLLELKGLSPEAAEVEKSSRSWAGGEGAAPEVRVLARLSSELENNVSA